MISNESWAEPEFASVQLGDPRRHRRLIEMVTTMAEAPAGKVTQVFSNAAEREGAYRFLENEAVKPRELGRAALHACLERTTKHEYFFVPIDGGSLTLTDRGGKFGFGRVGTTQFCSRGLEVMSAIGVDPEGMPLGYCGQEYWARGAELTKEHRKSRSIEKKETRHWLTVVKRIERERKKVEGAARPWYQLDRGGDFKEMLEWAAKSNAWVTVRANADRAIRNNEEKYLRAAMGAAPRLGGYELTVRKRESRKARKAQIEVRAQKIELRIRERAPKKKKAVPRIRFIELWAMLAREIGTAPSEEERIEWLLLTNRPVPDFATAKLVIRGYSYRWRIEDFHRTWKTSCGVEHAQLRSVKALERWAVTLAVVAIRIQRLIHLARTQPDLPASEELSKLEVDALLLHKQFARYDTGFMPTMKEAVTWIAEMGGYIGKSSGGPPGAQVTGRGLNRLMMAADTLRVMRKVIK